ncbi:30S ribosomal protein S10, chloroplastic [Tanacetum coccineum]
MDATRTTNAKTIGPVPLPTKKRIYCVLKSPNVRKDARFHFEIRKHQRLIVIIHPTAQTIDSLMQLHRPVGPSAQIIDSLMQLDLLAGVGVEVKLYKCISSPHFVTNGSGYCLQLKQDHAFAL